MRTRLLGLLLSLMACVLAALGIPLAAAEASAEQQHVIVDRIDDAARFAGLAQYVPLQGDDATQQRALQAEIGRYHQVYGIRAGVFLRGGEVLAVAPEGWWEPAGGVRAAAFQEALDGRRSHNSAQVWPWSGDRTLVVASPVVRDGDVVAVVLMDSPTGALRARILHRWLPLGAGEAAAMLVAVVAAVRLTGWVLRPVRVLDRATHEIATGRMAARVAAAGGPPELRRLAGSFNEMADHVELAMERQRVFVADASHQLRNPLAALMLRIELLGLELPEGHEEELCGVREEGRRLARVLDDLLGLATAEHARPEASRTDLVRLALDRLDAWRPLADRRGVALAWYGPPMALGWTDPVGFGSALDAVVDNALKFTPAGSEVRVEVAVRTHEIAVRVADSGPGLDDEELARVGDRFWRSPRHQNVDGSGLGLSIARTLLTAIGGGLEFGPNEPVGLVVTLTAPRRRDEA
jgi:signal transduction histidine kinase